MIRRRRNAPSSDVRTRDAGRYGSRLGVLRERLRTGDLRPEALRLAASLEDEDAELLCADYGLSVNSARWEFYWTQRIKTLRTAAGFYGRRSSRAWRTMLVSFACDCAERVLPLFEERHPDDARPREALELARRWARGEKISKAKLRAASDAAFVVVAGADMRGDDVAHYAAGAADHSAAATFVARAVATASDAAESAAYAVDAAESAYMRESRWQKLRLAQYALGEVAFGGGA